MSDIPTPPNHNPCCSSHGQPMGCDQYRRTHFVEVRPCCAADADQLRAEGIDPAGPWRDRVSPHARSYRAGSPATEPAAAGPTPTSQVTTSTGTTIRLADDGTNTLVILAARDTPAGMGEQEAGRVIGGGFQPAFRCAFTMPPETLRGIADLIDAAAGCTCRPHPFDPTQKLGEATCPEHRLANLRGAVFTAVDETIREHGESIRVARATTSPS